MPESLHELVEALQKKHGGGAFALVDQHGAVVATEGAWQDACGAELRPGALVEDHLPLLVGILPRPPEADDLWLPTIEVAPQVYIDFAIKGLAGQTLIAAWNASRHGLALQELMQNRNELACSYHTLEQMTQHLSQSMERLQSLYAFINHEMRNVAQNVRAAVELFALARDGEQQDYYLSCALTATKHLVEVASTELSTARTGHGHAPKEAVPQALVAQLVREFRPLAERGGLVLKAAYGPDADRPTPLDQQRLQFVLSNLINNAIKFTQAGAVEVSAERRVVGSREHLVFAVVDSGPGLSSEEIATLFAPFQQFGHAAKLPGTGLGLYICKHLTTAMGASLEVSSDGRSGCTFKVAVPLPSARSGPTH